MQTVTRPADLNIFRRWSISELAQLSAASGPPYSEAYLLSIRQGTAKIRVIFRLRMAKALGEPEATLFSSEPSDG